MVGFSCYFIHFLQMMTNFEPLHKLQAHDKYVLKCLLSPEYCEPNKYVTLLSLMVLCSHIVGELSAAAYRHLLLGSY
jgi:hypothetical protein